MNLQEKTVLITGASGGIGSTIAKTFAEAGARVIVGFGGNQKAAEQIATQINREGGQAETAGFDVRDEAQVVGAFAGFHTHPDILINNAGAFPFQPFTEMSAAEWDAVQASNLRSAFLCSREAVKHWQSAGKGGSIVNIASIAATKSQEQITHYCAAKAGLVALGRNMACEFGPNGIRVNTVSPGLVWRQTLNKDWPDGVARWNKDAPLGKVVQPADIANACLFLASDQAAAITGIELVVDAGISVALPF